MEQPKKDPTKETEIALSELEERVDRLRALYEQYFMGYEKLEPSVPRKEVERRFTVLRKQQLRNTALRFRFNVISQKYNTYSMYWTRICRQIEEGTFKRHVAKAAKRFGADPITGRREREEDASIRVELLEFDDADADAILAEAEAAVEVRPRPAPVPERPVTPAQEVPRFTLERPVTPSQEMTVAGSIRIARPAALPPGAKQPVLLRRQDAPPPSSPRLPAPPASSPRPAPSQPGLGSERRTPVAPPAVASTGRIDTPASPMTPRVPAPAATPPAAARPAAPGPYRPVARPPGSTNRIAIATPRTPMTPIRPVAPPGQGGPPDTEPGRPPARRTLPSDTKE